MALIMALILPGIRVADVHPKQKLPLCSARIAKVIAKEVEQELALTGMLLPVK